MFRIGEIVGFLHEKGTAKIISINDKYALIEDSDGFERQLLVAELIAIHSLDFQGNEIAAADPEQIEKKKGVIQTRKEEKAKLSRQHQGIIEWELDLHIEELVDSIRGLNSTEMMLKQLSACKEKFRQAKSQRVNRLIIIHGVGEGVLKNEIRSFLRVQEGIEFCDADFQKYGNGATLVIFHPNW
jgi:dsDNA-specific endonuclease/ATPase MutS2